MVTIYVWNFLGKDSNWGHASLEIRNYYISWWPSQPHYNQSIVSSNIYEAHPILYRNFYDDMAGEGASVGDGSPLSPDHIVIINCLNEDAIIEWWQRFGIVDGYSGPPQAWETTKMNCSTVVHKALQIGGGDKFASLWSSWNFVWTPNDVYQYALSIKESGNR